MDKEFVTYQHAVALKELGFNEPCVCLYDEDLYLFSVREQDDIYDYWTPAPSYSQVFRWFREKHNLFSEIQLDRTTEPKFCFVIFKYEHFGNYEKVKVDEWYLYRTYEEVEQSCLDKLIEITNAEIKNRG